MAVAQAAVWAGSSELASPFLARRKPPGAGSRWPRRDLATCAGGRFLRVGRAIVLWPLRLGRVLGRRPSRISFSESCRRLLEVRAPRPPAPAPAGEEPSSRQLRVAAPAAARPERRRQRSTRELVRRRCGGAVPSLSACPRDARVALSPGGWSCPRCSRLHGSAASAFSVAAGRERDSDWHCCSCSSS